jgi:hypothetical protein
MTSRERMQAAMSLGTPDRVPVMCQCSIGHMLLQLEVSPADFWCDAEIYVDGLFRIRELYDFDGILVSLHGHDPSWRARIASRRTTPAGEEIGWGDGSRTLFPRDELPRHFPGDRTPPSPPPRPGDEHLPPDYIPVSQGLRFMIDAGHRFDALTRSVQRSAGRYSVHGEITSPFDYVLDSGGHQAVLLALLDDPPSVHRALDQFTRRLVALARAMCRTGVDAIKISSPYAGAGFISPACYREFILPYERRIAETIRGEGVRSYLHTCGAIGDRIDMMIGTGVDGIECLDPPPLGNVDLEEALRATSGRCFIKGNVDSINTLLRGDPDEIRADVCARLRAAKGTGGFILSTACSIAPHVPQEHVKLLRELVETATPGHP